MKHHRLVLHASNTLDIFSYLGYWFIKLQCLRYNYLMKQLVIIFSENLFVLIFQLKFLDIKVGGKIKKMHRLGLQRWRCISSLLSRKTSDRLDGFRKADDAPIWCHKWPSLTWILLDYSLANYFPANSESSCFRASPRAISDSDELGIGQCDTVKSCHENFVLNVVLFCK